MIPPLAITGRAVDARWSLVVGALADDDDPLLGL
jgi:hypothetical protein